MKRGILLILVFISTPVLWAQIQQEMSYSMVENRSFSADSIPSQELSYLVHLYDTMVNRPDNMDLSGKEYEVYYSVESTPLIPKLRYPDGVLIMEGKKYDHLMLQYDTYMDAVVFFPGYRQIYKDVNAIIINSPAIDEFNPGIPGESMWFRYVHFTDTTVVQPDDGMYQVVYDGTCQYLKKYSSIIFIEEGTKRFKIREQRYIVNNGKAYRITGRKSVLKALVDKMPQVRKYIRSLNISVRGVPNVDMVKILSFYDHEKER